MKIRTALMMIMSKILSHLKVNRKDLKKKIKNFFTITSTSHYLIFCQCGKEYDGKICEEYTKHMIQTGHKKRIMWHKTTNEIKFRY